MVAPEKYWDPYLVSSGTNLTTLISDQMGVAYPYELVYVSGSYNVLGSYILLYKITIYDITLAADYEKL